MTAVVSDRLALVDGWLAEQRGIWESRTDRLEELVGREEDRGMDRHLDQDTNKETP